MPASATGAGGSPRPATGYGRAGGTDAPARAIGGGARPGGPRLGQLPSRRRCPSPPRAKIPRQPPRIRPASWPASVTRVSPQTSSPRTRRPCRSGIAPSRALPPSARRTARPRGRRGIGSGAPARPAEPPPGIRAPARCGPRSAGTPAPGRARPGDPGPRRRIGRRAPARTGGRTRPTSAAPGLGSRAALGVGAWIRSNRPHVASSAVGHSRGNDSLGVPGVDDHRATATTWGSSKWRIAAVGPALRDQGPAGHQVNDRGPAPLDSQVHGGNQARPEGAATNSTSSPSA